MGPELKNTSSDRPVSLNPIVVFRGELHKAISELRDDAAYYEAEAPTRPGWPGPQEVDAMRAIASAFKEAQAQGATTVDEALLHLKTRELPSMSVQDRSR